MDACLARPEAVTLLSKALALTILAKWPHNEVFSLILDRQNYSAQENLLGEDRTCKSLIEDLKAWTRAFRP